VRTNPPNAILLSFTTQPGILNVSDPSMGYVFVPGPQTARHQEFWIDGNLEMPHTDQWSLSYERQILGLRNQDQLQQQPRGTLKYDLTTCRSRRWTGQSPWWTARTTLAGCVDLQEGDQCVAADRMCAGTGYCRASP
jgi:hypothetical protein